MKGIQAVADCKRVEYFIYVTTRVVNLASDCQLILKDFECSCVELFDAEPEKQSIIVVALLKRTDHSQ